jgi:hypothetical protein
LLGLTPDALVTFTAGQIHSIAQRPPVPASGKSRRRR